MSHVCRGTCRRHEPSIALHDVASNWAGGRYIFPQGVWTEGRPTLPIRIWITQDGYQDPVGFVSPNSMPTSEGVSIYGDRRRGRSTVSYAESRNTAPAVMGRTAEELLNAVDESPLFRQWK